MHQIAYDFLIRKVIILSTQLHIITYTYIIISFDKQLTSYIRPGSVFVFVLLNDPSCNLSRCLFFTVGSVTDCQLFLSAKMLKRY